VTRPLLNRRLDGLGNSIFGVMSARAAATNLGGGTNETRIVIADFEDVILFENDGGAPSQLRFEQPAGNALGVMLVAYGYSALAAGRQPKAISVLAGTGLITPAL
jgi:hypothetical protein